MGKSVIALSLALFLFPIWVFGADKTVNAEIAECGLQAKMAASIESAVSFYTLDEGTAATLTVPANLQSLSRICSFSTTGLVDNKLLIRLTVSHAPTTLRPRIYFWNESKKQWESQITLMDRTKNEASIEVPPEPQILPVFADKREVYEGKASWYRHKRYPDGAATNIYPLGTIVKITNLANQKSTQVRITSTWTNTDSSRIIDLVSTAFQKIAKLGTGLIKVRMERISPAPDRTL